MFKVPKKIFCDNGSYSNGLKNIHICKYAYILLQLANYFRKKFHIDVTQVELNLNSSLNQHNELLYITCKSLIVSESGYTGIPFRSSCSTTSILISSESIATRSQIVENSLNNNQIKTINTEKIKIKHIKLFHKKK